MKNVIIDIGNYSIKYASDEIGKFSSRIHSNFEPNPAAFERIEIDGKTTYIGVGELEREYNKADKNIIPQVLYAISKATIEVDINLCFLLPINQLPEKNKMIQRFEKETFIFKINDKSRVVRINKCVVLPEGQCSYYSIKEPSKYQLIIDIGSKTVNWCAYIDGKMEKNGTEKIGVFDFYNTVMRIENAKGEDYIVEDIEAQIDRGRIQVSISTYKGFLLEILNRMKANINLKNYDVTFTGGGSLVFKNIIEAIPNIKIHDNPVYSNVLGAKIICEKMW